MIASRTRPTALSVFLVGNLLAFILLVGSGCGGGGETEETAADSIASSAPGTDLVVASLDATGDSLRVGPLTRLTSKPGYDNQPAFLASGDTLLWTAIREGQADIYRKAVGTPQSGTPERMTRTPESEFSPTPRPERRMTVVRVEADGRQRLWTYGLDGRPIEPVLPNADSVGYHAWLDSSRVALFELGTPPTLRVVNVETGTDTVVARRIGRALRSRPDRAAVSFVRVGPDSATAIHEVSGDPPTTRRLTGLPGDGTAGYHDWTPTGHLLMAAAGSVQAWHPDEKDWQPVANLDTLSVTRIAVSPNGNRLALVAAE